VTSKPPTELKTLIDTHIDGFNTLNRERYLSVFGDTAIIVDGIAPYLWLSPNGPAHWLDDAEKWRKANDVIDERVTYEMGFWNVEGDHAYVVISGTLALKLKGGQTVVRTGTLAYTFAKQRGVWKIGAQAWGRTS
jgi:ketosteroid isomerase-like protein